jgi:DNA polymerase-3 subunit delta
LEEEGKDEILRVLGMLNRQIRLLWQTKSVTEGGGRVHDVAKKLGLRDFQVRKLVQQSKLWTADNLERAFHLLYQADGLLKSGAKGHLVLENLVLSLCK